MANISTNGQVPKHMPSLQKWLSLMAWGIIPMGWTRKHIKWAYKSISGLPHFGVSMWQPHDPADSELPNQSQSSIFGPKSTAHIISTITLYVWLRLVEPK